MRRRRGLVRIGVATAAGLVLLVTAVPQVASGIGLHALANRLDAAVTCSGSSGGSAAPSASSSCCAGSASGGSGSGSSACATGPGVITGTVAVTDGPSGFDPPFTGVGACAFTGKVSLGQLCADPIYTLAQGGTYTLGLDPGVWVVDGFYENNAFGGVFLALPQVVTVTAGGTGVADFDVPYVPAATLDAAVKVQGLPAGVVVQQTTVLLCPSIAPFSGGTPPLTCVSSNTDPFAVQPSSPVVIGGLPSGPWIAYPGYCTVFGCVTNAGAGVKVALSPGRTTNVKLKTSYLAPPDGVVSAGVAVSGGPSGFSPAIEVTACQTTPDYGDCQSAGGTLGSSLPLTLTAGVWQITGAYLAPVFGNLITGPTETVDVVGGETTSLTLDVAYQVLGTATGSIKVTELPGGTRVTSYSVEACPVGGTAYDTFPLLSCVSEYSGPGTVVYGATDTRRLGRTAHRVGLPRAAGTKINSYTLPTLTPGQWVLNASYTTAFGTFFNPDGTTVTINGGATTTTRLTVPYQAPVDGVVTGGVKVIGAPGNGFQAGARACSSAPADGTCTDEVDAFLGNDGKYVLDLPAGTWWVQGLVYVFGATTSQEITSAPHQLSVSDGVSTKVNFTVPVS